MTSEQQTGPWSGPSAEGRYDPRKGAQGYSPIVASFGALAVTALAVVFTIPRANISTENLVLTTGLLAIAVFGCFLSSFALAAIGAEEHPTANLPAALMLISVPIAVAFVGILGAFQVLTATFVPEAAMLFSFITAAGGAASVMFAAAVVGDSWSMHPRKLEASEFEKWRLNQWIKDRTDATRESVVITIAGVVLVFIAAILRWASAKIELTLDAVFWTVGTGVVFTLIGTCLALARSRHPQTSDEQRGIRPWEAWTCTMAISGYAFWLVIVLPD